MQDLLSSPLSMLQSSEAGCLNDRRLAGRKRRASRSSFAVTDDDSGSQLPLSDDSCFGSFDEPGADRDVTCKLLRVEDTAAASPRLELTRCTVQQLEAVNQKGGQSQATTHRSVVPRRSRGKDLKRIPWTDEEETILKDAVAESTADGQQPDWDVVMAAIEKCGNMHPTHATRKACRDKWENGTDPSLKSKKKAEFTSEEEYLMIKAHKELGGNRWKEMQKAYLPDRAPNALKNHWNKVASQVKRKLPLMDPSKQLTELGLYIYCHSMDTSLTVNLEEEEEKLEPNMSPYDASVIDEDDIDEETWRVIREATRSLFFSLQQPGLTHSVSVDHDTSLPANEDEDLLDRLLQDLIEQPTDHDFLLQYQLQ